MPLIALIDDRQTNRSIFSQLAATLAADCEILDFGDAGAALLACQKRVPDLVISDYNMPGMNGAQFIRAFRDLPHCAEVPVIIITVHSERSWRLEALDAGATDVLSSPVDPVEFVTRGRNLLKLRQHQLALESKTRKLRGTLVSSKAQHLSALRESGLQMMQVIDSLPMVISAVDGSGLPLFSNKLHQSFFREGDVVARNDARKRAQADLRRIRQDFHLEPQEQKLRDALGRERRFMMQKSALRDSSGQVIGMLSVGFDMTDSAMAPALSPLVCQTLPNEKALLRHLQALMRRGRRRDTNFAVLAVQLNGFDEVNRLMGLKGQGHIPAVVLERLAEDLRIQDVLVQLSPDRLAIVQADIEGEAEALQLATRLRGIVRDCAALVNHQVSTSAHFGIALYPRHGVSAAQLLDQAKGALQGTKEGEITFARARPETIAVA